MKTIRLFSFPGLHPQYSKIKVVFNTAHQEYQVKHYDTDGGILPDLTYFTTDRMDALDTAQHIFNAEILRQQALEVQGE